ncbi:cytochrome b/b6 domain-containing protein [Microbacterium sp. JB110]|uniref:cytochrome b/b6 domain-containing protein n=1 Tax=Microbacterium sp. JB110 TaxID=2024477 RepID=UPI001481FADC|nr:cytochrome b/b6 domain-containing protein [Microbacterium sp. JB110]
MPTDPARPQTVRRKTTWVRGSALLLLTAALGVVGWCVIFGVRAVLSTDVLEAFLAAYPGEAPLPEGTAEGIPAFVSWTHFLNAFFLVLIIRSGLRYRFEKRAGGLWTSRRVKKRRMSLALWTHIGVDLLWLANGIVFVVLLFASGHWVRVVPTTWEIVPNAISAGLQYVSLDWPTHHSWVNYNALQQLSYFAIVFLAAPVAALTGWRLSTFWPTTLNRFFPGSAAKALHWPTMLFFVAFVVVHVFLVLTTGALRNLDAMYAGRDSATWVGFWVFAASALAMVVGWFAVRRDDWISRLAKLFGDVRMMKR